ncbi:MAG: hypothetical protein JW994_01685 [Candidatus Omnitrophica bacterium]|nr:hypothetical protein [Candidatus Omnitrophota bacterium]
MQEEFLGYHSEWNLGSPGGWDYQRMAQEIGKIAWRAINKHGKIGIELDFDDPALNPVPNFSELLLRANRMNYPGEKPFIALVAEKETLEKVGENIRFVKYLNTLPDVKAVLTEPSQILSRNGEIYYGNNRITSIFLDFNNSVIARLESEHAADGLLSAIKRGLVTNPRGMEPVGAKGVFEAVTSEYRDMMSETTLNRTPWTRQFYRRSTDGPDGEDIKDLIMWVKHNWDKVILKPVHGYSGKGIIIGHKEDNPDLAINKALDAGDYIVQPLIPLRLWAEDFPWLDKTTKKLFIKRWQTDFRCFVTDAGLIGFVTRFGGIPTNVGSGGGVQSAAILRSDVPLAEAVKSVNEAVLRLGFDAVSKIQNGLDGVSREIGNVYLLGPIMCTLRPRIITQKQIGKLREYAENLWCDALQLEKLWLEGKLARYVQLGPDEEKIALLAPWKGRPALIASDGLFGFTGEVA